MAHTKNRPKQFVEVPSVPEEQFHVTIKQSGKEVTVAPADKPAVEIRQQTTI